MSAITNPVNRVLDAILSEGIGAGRTIAEEIIRDVKRLAKKGLAPPELMLRVRRVLLRYEPLLSRTLSDTLLASWIAGATEIPRQPVAGLVEHRPTIKGEPIKFIPHEKASENEVMVMVDPSSLDASWREDESYYLPATEEGKSEIRGRREGFRKFLESKKPIQAPRVSFGEGGRVEIDDGRHRFAVLRDNGANVIAIMVPRQEADEFRRRFGVGLPPPRVPENPISAFGEGGSPVSFPVLEKAAADLLQRRVLLKSEFAALSQDAKRAAFTVARVGTLDALEKVQQALASGVGKGGSLRTFANAIGDVIDESALSPRHVENVFRTNTAQANSAGLMNTLSDPVVQDEFPYLAYFATRDGRVRPEHLAMETLGLDGTNVYNISDPIWQEFMPPWGYS